MNILVATDSYKGSMSASEATEIIADKIAEEIAFSNVIKMPIADGGEGSAECFVNSLSGGYVVTTVKNCYFEDTTVQIGLIDDGKTAIVEMAQAAGIKFATGRKNPMLTTTYGVGQMILVAAGLGVNKILLCLGGSATNDLGCGAAAALGIRFFNENDEEMLPVGGTLDEVCHIDASMFDENLKDIEIVCLCDIEATLTGEHGAAQMYSPQKGADEKMVKILEYGANHIASIIKRDCGFDILTLAGGGAAGGFGAGAVVFLNAKIQSGITSILDMIGLEKAICECDIVITGEGRVDRQSMDGKAISGVIKMAKENGVKSIVIGGSVEAGIETGADAVFSCVGDFCTFEEIKDNASKYLENITKNICSLINLS